MKMVSMSGEFAFFSFGGSAQGIIAVGGMAHGVIAFGGILSIGVVSIGMNAVGSVVAVGMNTAAPISISLINGLGVYTVAGVNGLGTWARAGTNSTGVVSQGGVNSDHSVIPAIVVILALIVASSVARGARERRVSHPRLGNFVRSLGRDDWHVTAQLKSVNDDDTVELADGDAHVVARLDEPLARSARALASAEEPVDVLVHLLRTSELVRVGSETGYRARPEEEEREVIRCLDIQRAPKPEHWLPKNRDEIQWTIAWTARIAVVVTIVVLVIALRG
jgi:hypothetical protein